MRRAARLALFLLAAGLAPAGMAPAGLAAQQIPEPGVTLAGGVMDFERDGVPSGGIVSLAFDSPLVPLGWHWVVEPTFNVGWFRPDTVRTRWLIVPEMQLQWQLTTGAVRPYAGAGGGIAFIASSDSTERTTDLSGIITAGIRARMGGLGLRFEVRRRTSDAFAGWTTEWLVGLSRRYE